MQIHTLLTLAAMMDENSSRNLVDRAGKYIGKLARYNGRWYVAGPRVLREYRFDYVLAMGVEEFNRRQPDTLRHFYECSSPDDAANTYCAIFAVDDNDDNSNFLNT